MHILNWNNITGVHCGSVAIRNVVNYFGVDYPEALCFGLGSGLGFFYTQNNISLPSEVIHLRAPNMEPNFFSTESKKYNWEKENDDKIAELKLINNIKSGFPVFLQTDIYHLHYYNSKVNFPGHVIVCVGVDEDNKKFYVSDTNFDKLQEVSFKDMNFARSSKAEPYPLSYNNFAVKEFSRFINLRKKIEVSILENSLNYFNGQRSERGVSSIFIILEWLNNIERWMKLKDSSDVFKFAYQIIVKRGSKGGGFRYIYEDFLKIAENKSKKIKSLKLAKNMREIGDKWYQIGLLLKQLSKNKSNSIKEELILLIKETFLMEYIYHTKVIDNISYKKKGA